MKLLLFVILVIPVLTSPAYATLHTSPQLLAKETPSDYTIPYLNNVLWIRENNPNICIVTSPFNVTDSGGVIVDYSINYTTMGLTDTTIKAVTEWQDKLNNATNSHKFNMHITTMSNPMRSLDHYYCDVIVLYDINSPFENAAGITHPVNLWRTFGVINVIYGNGTGTSFKPWSNEYLVKVTEHELGHMFGLDHIESKGEVYQTCSSPKSQLSIMFWCLPPDSDLNKVTITKYDVNAVVNRYDVGGFGALNIKAGDSYALTNVVLNTTENNGIGNVSQTNQTSTIFQTLNTNQTSSQRITTNQTTNSIPNWIHNNAKWWHDNEISNEEFEKGIQFLIQQNILKVPATLHSSSSASQIPSWIKNNAGWWADGQISDDEFIMGIQWLVSNGIIKV